MALCFASGFFWTDSESVVNSDNKVDEDADADTDAAGDIRKSGTQVITSNAATMKDSSSMFSPALTQNGVPTDPQKDEILHLHVDVTTDDNYVENQTDNTIDIQIVSDLHIEMYRNQILPDELILPRAPVLALLGDIGLSYTEAWQDFVTRQSQRFQHVLVLAGNHEYYNVPGGQRRSILQQFDWMRQVCASLPNVHFLERRVVNVNNGRLIILAATLWSYIPPEAISTAERSMNDYHVTFVADESNGYDNSNHINNNNDNNNNNEELHLHRMQASLTNRWHDMTVTWLEKQLLRWTPGTQQPSLEQRRSPPPKVLVLTHHVPDLHGTSNPRFLNSPLTVCFASDLRRFLRYPVHTWACGHTHYNFDQYYMSDDGEAVDGTRLVSNQRGYPGQEKATYRNEGIVLALP